MQEIAGAIREGAQAYLNRQYTTIAIVGVVIFVVAWLLLGWLVAIGFLIGAVLSGAGRLHRHERLGARQRAHGAGGDRSRSPRGLDIAFKSGAVTGMLVAGLALLGVAGYFLVPHRPASASPSTTARSSTRSSRSASAPR